MSGGKGSNTQTVNTVNPVQQMQAPYLQDAWQKAQDLYQGQQAQGPGSTIATWGQPALLAGYQGLYDNGLELDKTLRPAANTAFYQGAQGNIYNSPAYGYYQNLAQGLTGPQQNLGWLGDTARNVGQAAGQNILYQAPVASQYGANAAAGNLGLSQLGRTASGEFINGNPWFSAMVQNAMDPITRNYQTSVAPQLDAAFMNSGRYGSGAMLGQRENAQNVLAKQLADTSENLYGQNYARERAAQDAAAQAYGSLYNQGQQLGMQGAGLAANIANASGNQYLAGLGQAANIANQNMAGMGTGAAGLQGGYQSGNAAALQAAGLYPQFADAQYSASRNAVLAGQGANAMQQQYIDEPYNMLDRYLKQIGAIQGGSSSTTSPYYTNPFASAMSGITGGLDIMQKLGGMGGLGGSGGSVPSGWIPGTGMGSGIYTNAATGVTSDVAGSGFPGLGAVGAGMNMLGGGGGILGGIGSMLSKI